MIHYPPRRILVALDGTPESLDGWRQARALGAILGARLEAVYVHGYVPAAGDFGFAEAMLAASDRERLTRWLRARIGLETPLHSLDGDPATRIVHFAEHGGFDLVVMGTHGRHGLSRALIGSVAESVARRSKVPVLVARGHRDSFRSVLAPVNLAPYSQPGLQAAAGMAEALGARLTVLSVVAPPEPTDAAAVLAVRRLQREWVHALPRCCREAARPVGLMAFGEPVSEILRECAREPHDLVVLVSHLRRPVRDRLLGTTAERVLRRSPLPVLVVPMPVVAKTEA